MKLPRLSSLPHRPLSAKSYGQLGLILALLVVCGSLSQTAHAAPGRWWKGNLHTHSLWSDGDDFPEMIVAWYHTNGYHFLALSDHNVMLIGGKWVSATNKAVAAALPKYQRRFGAPWVEQMEVLGGRYVRLKPLDEFRGLFEKRNQFLLIPSEEISDHFKSLPIHLNATNLRDLIRPQGGTNVLDVMQRNVDAVLAQRRETGQPMFPHINHPNFGWAITAEELMRVQGDRFFEIYNGHPSVHNEGDSNRLSVERMWDVVLTWRLAVLKLDPMFGLAVDDAHNYQHVGSKHANPGRGWVVVQAPRLTPGAIIAAMEAGDFYASTGVRLSEVRRGSKQLSVTIDPEPGVSYVTQFIGTKISDISASDTASAGNPSMPETQRFGPQFGRVLAEAPGTSASYTLRGDELYVRAKITSSKTKANPYAPGEFEVAWTQPVVP